MARLRNFVCYREPKRPYTRYSKYKKYSYIRSRPHNRISRYTTGEQGQYYASVHLVSKQRLQIRDSAIESARLSIVRTMEKALGKTGFFFQIRIFPHHILRENPLAAGAGADRLSTGMAHNYGKPIGIAAQIREGQQMFTVYVKKEHVSLARGALKKASYKLPCKCMVDVTMLENGKKVKAPAKKPAVKSAAKAEPAKEEVKAE